MLAFVRFNNGDFQDFTIIIIVLYHVTQGGFQLGVVNNGDFQDLNIIIIVLYYVTQGGFHLGVVKPNLKQLL